LTSSVVRLRAITAEDSTQWLAWLQDAEILGLMDMIEPVSEQQHQEFLRYGVDENPTARWFAIEREGRFIGKVWLWDISWRHRRAEVRILIGDRDSWGRGAGSAALAKIASYACNTLGLHKVYAFVHQRNERSRRAFLKAGFFEEVELREEACWDGRFQSVFRLALLAGDQI
jgi:RimJ/RimL family protein N-acetyltransferase